MIQHILYLHKVFYRPYFNNVNRHRGGSRGEGENKILTVGGVCKVYFANLVKYISAAILQILIY